MTTMKTLTAKELNTLAFFMYDENKNLISDHTSVPLFSGVASFKGIDFSLPSNGYSTYNYNNRIIHTKNWSSPTNGISVAMFY